MFPSPASLSTTNSNAESLNANLTIATFDAKKMQQIIAQCLPDINTVQGKELILVVGRTKSGKSTATNYLMGARRVKYIDDDGMELVKLDEGQVEYAPISPLMKAHTHTLAPRGCTDAHGITYCDTPSFDDRQSREYRICTTGFMQAGIAGAASIKMLAIIIDVGLLYADPCARELLTLVEMLSNITSDVTKFSQNIIFILTKANTQNSSQVIARIKKLQTTLERSLTAAQKTIEQLTQISQTSSSVTDELQKYKNQMHLIKSQIAVIQMVNAKNTFRLDVFDNGESRQTLVNFLQANKNLEPISKEAFNFESSNQDWLSFSKAVNQLVGDATNLLEQRLSLPAELWCKKESFTNLSKRKDYLQSKRLKHLAELKMNHDNSFSALIKKHRRCVIDIWYLQNFINFLNKDTTWIFIHRENLQCQNSSDKRAELPRMILSRSTDKFWRFHCDNNINNEAANMVRESLSLARRLPHLGELLSDVVKYQFYTADTVLPNGLYLNFNRDGYFSGSARDLLGAPSYIKKLEQHIDSIQTTMKDLECKIPPLKRSVPDSLEKTFPCLEELAERQELIHLDIRCNELIVEIAALETTLSSVKEQMNASIGMHAILPGITPLLTSRTISEFSEKYTAYERLSAQERDDGLFLSMQKFYIDPDKIDWSPQFAHRLGGSGTAEVYKRKATGIDNVMFVAVKQIFALKLTPELLHEAKLMAQFSQHSNIVKFYGITQSRQSPTASYVLVLECMECSLYDILYDHNIADNELPVEWRIKIALQIIKAIIYLHESGLIHRDIKSPNILLSEDQNLAKLADFGISKPMAAITDTCIGTACWMAPELSKGGATKATDIFALGIVLAEMVNRELPFNGNMAEYNQYQNKIQAGLLVFSDKFPALSSLGQDCTKVFPHERPTAQQCHDQLTNFKK